MVAPGWEFSDHLETGLLKEGFKGWHAVAKYTIAKNMVADVEYWDLKGRVNNHKDKALFTGLYVTF